MDQLASMEKMRKTSPKRLVSSLLKAKERSIKEKKWVSPSIMRLCDHQRSNSRLRSKLKIQLMKDIQEKEGVNNRKSIMSKKSQHLATKVVRRRILAIVEGLSQRGYISFQNF
mmetsp:Transcript_30942/g.27372  ORF Transcript_30942/g.27372 Transcript_30942/m.27372 type:complete len:113 (+) Transcript_30942:150-488(+)